MPREISNPAPYDLERLAPNGLRRGFTTGTCATAAVKAAAHLLLHGEVLGSVRVSLPDGLHYLEVPVESCSAESSWVRATVQKDAGDDPDQTHLARIGARVRRNSSGRIVFLRGPGVGLVTQPGLQVPVGEPAINPVPRSMIRAALAEVLDAEETGAEPGEKTFEAHGGFDVEISCENGEEIAQRTFNPRLGIQGGISILGTTGIVEPKSLASFKAAIEVYLRVAIAEQPECVVLSPGNLGQRFARTALQLPLKQIVQMSNFAGFAIDFLQAELEHTKHTLRTLWVVGHPGKLCKLLLGAWDTHSQSSPSAVPAVVEMAHRVAPGLVPMCMDAPSVEAVIERLGDHPDAARLWEALEHALNERIHARIPRSRCVRTVLFALTGKALGSPLGTIVPGS
jgi:cobalt-precorrin-5B (C1)-methyltransferase